MATPLETVRAFVAAFVTGFMGLGGVVNVDLRHSVADGAVVLTERIDHVTRDGRTLSMPMMGIFEVHDGVITAWRDYFDLAQFTAQLEAGPAISPAP